MQQPEQSPADDWTEDLGVSLLLVEDNPSDARLLREHLRDIPSLSCNLDWVRTLDEARARLEPPRGEKGPDLALVDLDLPDSSGMETIRALIEAGGEVPLVILTGRHDGVEVVSEALSLGVQDYLHKGRLGPEDLLRSIRTSLHQYQVEKRLRQSEEQFRQLADNVEEIFWIRTPGKDQILYVNSAYERVTGLSRERVYEDPQAWLELIHPDDRPRVEAAYRRDAPAAFEEEYRIVRPDGEERWIRDRAFPVEDDDGKLQRIVGVAEDITERHRAHRALARAKKKYQAVFDVNPVSLVVIDADSGRVLEVNRGYETLYGYPRDEVEGKSLADVDSYLDSQRMARIRRRALEEGEVRSAAVRARRKDGEVRDVLVSYVRVSVEGDTYLIGASEDVSPLRETERDLRRRALHDALTGLPNRALLRDRCEQAIRRADRRGESFAVAYLDLDGFKPVNDAYGHGIGDEVLSEVAERLRARTRDEDTVGRMGGDEFVVLLEGLAGEADARQAMDRLFGAFEEPFRVPDGEIGLEASCGVVVVAPEVARALLDAGGDVDESVGDLVREADQAMYAAKEKGGGRIQFVQAAELSRTTLGSART